MGSPIIRSNEEAWEIVEDNLGLAVAYTRRYINSPYLQGMCFDTVLAACYVGLYKAALIWDPGKGEYSTIAYWKMREAIQVERRKVLGSEQHPTTSMVTDEGEDMDAPDPASLGETQQQKDAKWVKEVLANNITLTDKERIVLKFWYEHEWTMERIAEQVNRSKQRIQQIIDSALAKLRKEMGVK